MTHTFFTSESVSIGHPDKIADQISDAILDECLRQDPKARVACETMVAGNRVVLAGEITTSASIDYEAIARETIRQIGYDNADLGFDADSCEVTVAINKQSSDIAQGVDEGNGLFAEQGAGDQGMMFGYACNETEELMPLAISLAHRIMHAHSALQRSGEIDYLRPDAKSQVTIEQDQQGRPLRVKTVVLSTQHAPEASREQIAEDMERLIRRVVPSQLIDEQTEFLINPTGRFVTGGPVGDCGLTGRKIIVDTYGGSARHGGGAFSGKDPSKVDRSAAYAARYVAKNVVAAGLAKRCEVQVAYAIGVAKPVSIKVDTYGTSTVDETAICAAILNVFDLSPKGIIDSLQLQRPIYKQVAFGGHFGRSDLDLPWEQTDRTEQLLEAVQKQQAVTA